MSTLTLLRSRTDLNLLSGIFFVILFAMSALTISTWSPVTAIGLSPLIVGIGLGMIYGNTLRPSMPAAWLPGIRFSTRPLLRAAIILYGFRVTFQDVAHVGMEGALISVSVVLSTFTLGTFVGTKFLGLDRKTAILTTVGSSVCGAAAILATEPVIKAESHKSSMAVATVVVFGTLTMFLYPFLYKAGLLGLDETGYGMYVGGTIHEVAHAVGAGRAVSEVAGNASVIVKMLRVMMIAPLLIGVSLWLKFRPEQSEEGSGSGKVSIPWFAVLFLVVAGINSLGIIPQSVVDSINALDSFMLTMTMCALGMETNFAQIRKVGAAPVWLATLLFFWVTCGGYWITVLVRSLG